MQNKPILNKKMIILIFVEFVFVILVIFGFVSIFKKETIQPEIKVENFKIDGVSEEIVNQIERDVYNTVALNGTSLANVSNYGATVRDGSTINRYMDKLNINYLYTIIDIPSVQQSYQVRYIWSDDTKNKNVPTNTNLITMCLPQDKMIYETFECHDNYNNIGVDIALSPLIQKTKFTTSDGIYYDIDLVGNMYNIDNFYYRVKVSSCEDKNMEKQVQSSFENWISSFGFEADEIRHQILGYCDK